MAENSITTGLGESFAPIILNPSLYTVPIEKKEASLELQPVGKANCFPSSAQELWIPHSLTLGLGLHSLLLSLGLAQIPGKGGLPPASGLSLVPRPLFLTYVSRPKVRLPALLHIFSLKPRVATVAGLS